MRLLWPQALANSSARLRPLEGEPFVKRHSSFNSQFILIWRGVIGVTHQFNGNRMSKILTALGLLLFSLAGADLPKASGQQPVPQRQLKRHHFHSLPSVPGRIGWEQLMRVPNGAGYFQPVELRGPKGSLISLASNGGFLPDQEAKLKVGIMMGHVYRFRIGNIPLLEGHEVYPTVELINRLHPPPGLAAKFPIPIELTREELEFALKGHMVTRVIYLEDPNNALGIAENNEQRYFDVDRALDPLHMADRMGRPMAILRMGSRVPMAEDDEFGAQTPPAQVYPEVLETKLTPQPNPVPPAAAGGEATPLAVPPVGPAEGSDSVAPTSGLQLNGPAPIRQAGPARRTGPKRYPRLPYRYELTDPPANVR